MTNKRIPLFAILIGINSYKVTHRDFAPLRGAVPDALAFKAYLEGSLNVPSDQIVLLTNENATRAKIVDVLQRLRDDKRIAKGDAIFLYYAGHGIEIDPPKYREFEAGKKIQAIVPYDCDVDDETKNAVPPLPDYVLGILLSKIAETKGDNITVIFDCCHSASGTRGVRTSNDEIARRVVLQSSATYSEQLNQEISELETVARGTRTLSDFSYLGLGSHILLAACGLGQLAHESNGRGRFSTALLKLLNQVPYNTLRYSDILNHPSLDLISGQDPQCEGLHTNRTLFNGEVLCAQQKSFSISLGETHGEYVVGGGEIHNITLDSEFGVYRKTDINLSRQMGVLYVHELQPFSFIAKLPSGAPHLDLAHPIDAVQIKFGKQIRLRIHIPPQDGFHKVYDNLAKNSKSKHYFHNIALADTSKDAQVEIALLAKNKVEFKMHTKAIVPDQVTPIARIVEADSTGLAWIFSKMAHFYWETKQSHINTRISRSVHVEFYQLREEYIFNEDTGCEDTILKQVDSGSNLCVDGIIELPAHDKGDGQIPYGIKLINKSGLSLYANVFYFSNHDLKISAWARSHHGCTSQRLDTPLEPKGGSLEIGFGTAGYPPKTFKITNGLDTEVGFFKIYLSTESVDLAYLPQPSPFTPTRSMMDYKPKPPVIWTDIVIPIVIRRHRTYTRLNRN